MDQPIDPKEAILNIMYNMDSTLQAISIQASLYKAAYDSLISNGFSEQQAMDIVKARGNLLI